MENIENLSERELLDLKERIEKRINKIKEDDLEEINRKNSVKNKTKLSELTSKDRMLGIRFSWDHTNNNPNSRYIHSLKSKWVVDIVDYVDVEFYQNKKSRNSEWDYFSMSYKKGGFGFGTPLNDEESEKHYLINLDTSNTGYDGFFTLFPKTWESDIKEVLEYEIKQRKKYYNRDIKILKDKVKLVLNSRDMINKEIEKLTLE